MAFGFFRRHQKVVIIAMAVLMASFGLTASLSSRGCSGRGGDVTYGTLRRDAKVTTRDIYQATADLQFFEMGYLPMRYEDIGFLLLASEQTRAFVAQRLWFSALQSRQDAGGITPYEARMLQQMVSDFMTRIDRINRAGDRGRAYALLVAEARSMGLTVSQEEIDVYFARIGASIGSKEYTELMTKIRDRMQMSDTVLAEIVARWLLVQKSFEAGMVNSPPSMPRLEHLYAELVNRINLRVLAIHAEEIANEIPAPSDDDVQAMFETYRDVKPGTCTPERPFGFGYYLPDRIGVVWCMLPEDVMQRVVGIDMVEARRIYRENAERYTKEVPVETPATAPATQVTTQPLPPKTKTVPKTLAEALPEIISQQRTDRASREMTKFASRIQDRINKAIAGAAKAATQGAPDPALAFTKVYNDLIDRKSAADALSRKLGKVAIKDMALDDAIPALAAAARVSAICYPYDRPVLTGKDGKGVETLPAETKVTLDASEITLGEALDRLGKQLKVPQLEWVSCADLGGVLFTLSKNPAAETFPVSVGNSGLIDVRGFVMHPILGHSFTAPERQDAAMVSIAFKAEGLTLPDGESAVSKVARPGLEMFVSGVGRYRGRLLWTLTDVQPSAKAQRLTPELRAKVVRDWRLQKAFETRVVPAAKRLEAAAMADGLEAAAKAAKKETTTTEPFARREVRRISPWEPNEFPIGNIPGIDLPPMPAEQSLAIRKALMDKAFSLAPDNVEPPYPTARRVGVLSVPSLAACFVVERIEYRPPVRSEFEKMGRAGLYREIQQSHAWTAKRDWFTYDNIVKRTGFKMVGEDDASTKDEASD